MASVSKKAKFETIKSTDKPIDNDEEFPTDWDIDVYRKDHESEEHWMLRRRFMEVHKQKFPEQRLVCLAQAFTNIEFMGCKYPNEVMRIVGELSQEVAKEFRAQRANRLKRTFVAASDAAEARAKGNKRVHQQLEGTHDEPCCSKTMPNKRRRLDGDEMEQKPITQPHGMESTNKRALFDGKFFRGLRFDKFVLYLNGGRQCIRTSAQRCSMEYIEREVLQPKLPNKKVEICLNDKLVANGTGDNIKSAKADVFWRALEVLQLNCYTIKLNALRATIKIDKSNNQVVCDVIKQQIEGLEDKKLDASNKGYKMMQMMGWAGGGLGSKTQGREEPVGYLLKNNRAGLGKEACKLDYKYFTQMLKNYINSEDIRDLVFEPTFTKEERAMLHELAGKFNLKSTSHGRDEARRLIITKKNLTSEQILTEVLLRKNANYCDQYFVQVPESKFKQFPEHTDKLVPDSM